MLGEATGLPRTKAAALVHKICCGFSTHCGGLPFVDLPFFEFVGSLR
jgi:hypothetical protein